MATTHTKKDRRTARRSRIRARVSGSDQQPRLAVFRSNRYVYAQLINDETGTTLASADSRTADGATLTERATAVGSALAKKAQAAGIERVVFDRSGYRYQGIVAALAEAARTGGLKF